MENNEINEDNNILYVYLMIQVAMFICAVLSAHTQLEVNSNIDDDDDFVLY